jgi:aldose sugar dehydrogenase
MQSRGSLPAARWFFAALLSLALAQVSRADDLQRITTEKIEILVRPLAELLEHPWSVAFLPDGRLLISERPGRLRLFDEKHGLSSPLAGVPQVFAQGQGGLLDVVLDPQFAANRLVYLSYAEPQDGGRSTTVVARARLSSGVTPGLEDLRVIFRQLPAVESAGHFGSRLVFAPDGTLFVTLGERQAKHFTIRAQDLESHFGKIVRLTGEGQAPSDNPFRDVPGAQPQIWSYGHRNVQGAAIHPLSGELWVVEHGPKGGDELNIAKAGLNYGWPLVTYGVAYSGARIGVGAERAGMEPPVRHWVPSIATSSLAFYTGAPLAAWRGNAFVGGLYGVLVRLELEGNRVTHEERLLRTLKERIRDVRQGPDGLIYVLTDSPKGRLFRLEPAPADRAR